MNVVFICLLVHTLCLIVICFVTGICMSCTDHGTILSVNLLSSFSYSNLQSDNQPAGVKTTQLSRLLMQGAFCSSCELGCVK